MAKTSYTVDVKLFVVVKVEAESEQEAIKAADAAAESATVITTDPRIREVGDFEVDGVSDVCEDDEEA